MADDRLKYSRLGIDPFVRAPPGSVWGRRALTGGLSIFRDCRYAQRGGLTNRFIEASSVSVIRVDPTPPPAHRCA